MNTEEYTYLKAKLKIDMGDNYIIQKDTKMKFQSLEEIKAWVKEEKKKLPSAMHELGKILIEYTRVYENPKFNRTWTTTAL